MLIPHRKYLVILSLIFAVWWLLLAIVPWHRDVWLTENMLVVPAIAFLVGFHRKLLFSRVSYTLIFTFMCLHQVGAHYSYAEVPYDIWVENLTSGTLNDFIGWQRNNFDRVGHFSYGLLLAYPIREIFLRVADVRGFWGYFLPLDLTMSTSMLFELIEWLVAALFGGDLGQGAQPLAGAVVAGPDGHSSEGVALAVPDLAGDAAAGLQLHLQLQTGAAVGDADVGHAPGRPAGARRRQRRGLPWPARRPCRRARAAHRTPPHRPVSRCRTPARRRPAPVRRRPRPG